MATHIVWTKCSRLHCLCAALVISSALTLLYTLWPTTHERSVSEYKLPDIPCEARFGKTPQDDLEKIMSYNLSLGDNLLRNINLKTLSPDSAPRQQTWTSGLELPVIVTGASSNHFRESLVMLQKLNSAIRSKYTQIDLFYFDLGLTANEIKQIQQVCKCTVVKFPFDVFPPHVAHLKSYCWKPIIINIMLQTRKFVMWADSSIALHSSYVDQLFRKAKEAGIMMLYNIYPLPAHTHKDTFQFLNETPCLYKDLNEFHAACIFIHADHNLVMNYIMRPWLKCSLIEECMKTTNSEFDWLKCNVHDQYHACHRFDQSVISLLMHRVFHGGHMNHAIPFTYFNWFEYK